MAVENDAERDALLLDFGTNATYTPTGGVAVTVRGIFDEPYSAADLGGFADFSTLNPSFITKTAAVASADYGDAITINSVDYIIREVMPDGVGFTTFTLEKV